MKIISLAPSNTDIITELGEEDKLEAVSSLNQDMDFEKAGGWVSGPKLEVINKIDPDYVLTSDRLQRKVREQLEEKGYNVKHYEPETLEDVYQTIMEISKLLNSRNKAERVVENMKSEFAKIDLKGAKIHCEEWSQPPMISGNWIPGLVEELNGRYMIKKGRSREVSVQEIKSFNPEYIFLNICGEQETLPEQIKQRRGWNGLKAVERNQIYQINDSFLNRASPKLIEGAKKIQDKILEN